ncbi:hypothetical protein EYZ11_005763 [Aspergillus tanneri]|uniref:Uncharacterized protein n=1 Tax=Aspergillus tanneri TaxID=1220188 RepID=A0A4S3JN54_9EURO|nr:hypothetical protein EYZ11_005763 [Aspergillus tanneri]
MCSREREVHELVAGKTPAEAEGWKSGQQLEDIPDDDLPRCQNLRKTSSLSHRSSNVLTIGRRFYREEYELVIASNVRTIYFATHEEIPLIAALELHATSVLHDTPVNLKALLKPLGRLFLQEFSPGPATTNNTEFPKVTCLVCGSATQTAVVASRSSPLRHYAFGNNEKIVLLVEGLFTFGHSKSRVVDRETSEFGDPITIPLNRFHSFR